MMAHDDDRVALSPATIARELLHAGAAARSRALDALEANPTAHESSLAQATASALTDVLSQPAHDVDRATFRRAALLRGRLAAESEDPVAIFGAAHRSGRLLAAYDSLDSMVGQLLQKPPAELQRNDALDYACLAAMDAPASRFGWDPAIAAVDGGGVKEFARYACCAGNQNLISNHKTWWRLAELLLDLLSQQPQRLPPLETGGAWTALNHCVMGRHELGKHLIDHCDIFPILAASLRAEGSGWLSAIHSRGDGVSASAQMLWVCVTVLKARAGEVERPDIAAFIASGLFDLCLSGAREFEVRGTVAVRHTVPGTILCIFTCLRTSARCCTTTEIAKFRAASSSLAFAINPENNLCWYFPTFTTNAYAGQLCAAVFGRDEGDTGFIFSQASVDAMVGRWQQIVSGAASGVMTRISADAIQALELCISDANKPLLLQAGVVGFLTESLLLDPNQKRLATEPPAAMDWLQQIAAECFAQLAMFAPGRLALLEAEATVKPALTTLATQGQDGSSRGGARTAAASRFAQAALSALYNKRSRDRHQPLQEVAGGSVEVEHVMLSYNWEFQSVIKRLNNALKFKGYRIWIDVEKMQGSTIESMSAAVRHLPWMLRLD